VSKDVDLLSLPAQSSNLLDSDLISPAPTSAPNIYGDVSQSLSSIYSSDTPASIYTASSPAADLLSGPPPVKPNIFDGLNTQVSVAPSQTAGDQNLSSIYSSNMMGLSSASASASASASGPFSQMKLTESSPRAALKEVKGSSDESQRGPFDDILVSKASLPKVKTAVTPKTSPPPSLLLQMGMPSDSYLSTIHQSSSGLEVKAISKSSGGNHVLLLVHFCNLGEEDLNVDVDYLIPSGFHCSYGGDPYPAITGDAATLPMLKYGAAASHLITVMETPRTADAKNAEISFKLRINKNGVREEEIVQVPPVLFSYVLFLQPKVMTEQEFGASWAPYSCERKFDGVFPAISSPTDFEERVQGALNARVVKIIGNEIISCAQHALYGLCLIHARLANGKIFFILRSTDMWYTNLIADLIAKFLQ